MQYPVTISRFPLPFHKMDTACFWMQWSEWMHFPVLCSFSFCPMMYQTFERFDGCENSNIYVIVTDPRLFSAPGVGVRVRDQGSAPGPKSRCRPPGTPKNPYFADTLFPFAFCHQILRQIVVMCLNFGSHNKYSTNFRPNPPQNVTPVTIQRHTDLQSKTTRHDPPTTDLQSDTTRTRSLMAHINIYTCYNVEY